MTGITGYDGAYVAEFLIEKGCEVHEINWPAFLFNTQRINHCYEKSHMEKRRMILHYDDLTDAIKPDSKHAIT
ncbi:MAG: GDP-mannose 4,6-dehydratase [Bacteroidales bacterium]|nr:GDP-mannose 4,6-dehydratase [Bacteroidales bacterium]